MTRSGIDAERELVNKMWEAGFAVMRAPASGAASKTPRPDLLAGKADIGKIYAIELKISKSTKIYIEPHEIEGLVLFAQRFGAEAIVGVKFKGKRTGFLFLHPEELRQTKSGRYVIDLEVARARGNDLAALASGKIQQRLDQIEE